MVATRWVGMWSGRVEVIVWSWHRRCLCLFGGDFGDCGSGGGFVDDRFLGGVGGDEGLDGEVVDGAG